MADIATVSTFLLLSWASHLVTSRASFSVSPLAVGAAESARVRSLSLPLASDQVPLPRPARTSARSTKRAFEKTGGHADLESCRSATRFHPRCGTSFLLVVMLIALLVYLFLPFQSFAWKLISRIALLPVIAGVSYEFIRFAAKAQGGVWWLASQPGLWLQRITTREPDDVQLETAIKALESTMELEKARGGELVVA
jgi:hypothetical protein